MNKIPASKHKVPEPDVATEEEIYAGNSFTHVPFFGLAQVCRMGKNIWKSVGNFKK